MALIVSAASGNFNAGATWVGGVVPGGSDEGQAANGHTITITANATCGEISNSGTGKFVLNSGVTLTANVTNKSAITNTYCLEFSAVTPATATLIGNCTAGSGSFSNKDAVRNISSGTLVIQGNCLGGTTTGGGEAGASNTGIGTINIFGNCQGGNSGTGGLGCKNSTTGTLNIQGNVTAGSVAGAHGAVNLSTGILSVVGPVTATANAAAVAGTNLQQVTILSGPFITETSRGVNPVYCTAWRWNASPSNSTYMEVMTNNLLAKRNLVTADNITGMPAASNVKSGIAYGPSNELTGTFSQTVTPSTADIATAVWGAATRSITGGTVDTLTNAPASVTPSDIWSHASRTVTGGTVDTLTNAPSVPSASAIASQVRSELSVELSRIDAATSTRATPANIPTADISAIKVKTDALNITRLAQVSTTEIVGNLLAQANS